MRFDFLGKLLIKFKSSDFLKHFSITISGTTIIFFIQLLTTPIISRIYSPQNYGDLALFSLILSNVSILALFGFQDALMMIKNEFNYWALSKLIIGISALVGILFFLVTFFFGDFLISLISNKTSVDWWVYLIPFLIIFHGIGTVLNSYLVKEKKFRKNSGANVISRFVSRMIVVGLGFLKFYSIGLIIGDICLMIVMVVIKARDLTKKIYIQIININYHDIKKIYREFISYPKFILPGQYLNIVSNQLPIIYISSIFGTSTLGYYTFASSILNIPIQLIGNSLKPVFFQYSSDKNIKTRSLFKFTLKVFGLLLVLGAPVFIMLMTFGEVIFELIFGEQWTFSGEIASILSIYLVLSFLSHPISTLFFTMRKEKLLLEINVIRFIFRGVVLSFCFFYNKNFIDVVWYYTITNFLIFAIQIWLNFRIIKSD